MYACVRVRLANASPFSPDYDDGGDKGGGDDNNTGLLTLRDFLHDDAFGSTRNRHGSSGGVAE